MNIASALIALAMIQAFGWTFGVANNAQAVRWAQLLIAGFGSMALFRSSLFNVRIGESDVSIGPSQFLQVILTASDHAVDRHEAKIRASHVKTIMQGVEFEKAKVALPALCGGLMQNLSNEAQLLLSRQIRELASTQDIDSETKADLLGLILVDAVGEDVLKAAVESLGRRIR